MLNSVFVICLSFCICQININFLLLWGYDRIKKIKQNITLLPKIPQPTTKNPNPKQNRKKEEKKINKQKNPHNKSKTKPQVFHLGNILGVVSLGWRESLAGKCFQLPHNNTVLDEYFLE